MPEYLSPGVYIEEKAGPRPIQGVGTAMAAFIGFAPSGPANRPVLITSWTQYKETFGLLREEQRRDPHMQGAYLSYAVYGYFLNGGGRCYVTRLLTKDQLEEQKRRLPINSSVVFELHPDDGSSSETGGKKEPGPQLEVSFKPNSNVYSEVIVSIEPQKKMKESPEYYGWKLPAVPTVAATPPAVPKKDSKSAAEGTDAAPGATAEPVKAPSLPSGGAHVEAETGRYPSAFTIRVSYAGADARQAPRVVREFVDLTVLPDCNFVDTRVRDLTLEDPLPVVFKVKNLPNRQGRSHSWVPKQESRNLLLPYAPVDVKSLTASAEDYEGDTTNRNGIVGLDSADGITMIICPDLAGATHNKNLTADLLHKYQKKIVDYCEHRRECMALLDTPYNMTPQDVAIYKEKTANFDSAFATLYYPWVKVMADDGKEIEVPPSGYIAGVWARSDQERGVHKAPANEVIRGITGLSWNLTKGEQDVLNPMGVNCLRNFPGRGLRVWGARTLSSDPAWRYLNVRRLFNFVEKSIEIGTQWVVFEPNDSTLWAKVTRDVSSFLRTVWLSGALFGNTDKEAFYVKCDAELNTRETIDMGQLIIEVGIAPVKPAEFVVFRFSQIAS